MSEYKKFCKIKDYCFDGDIIYGELMMGHRPTVSYYLLDDGDCYRPEKLIEEFKVDFFDSDPRINI